MGDDSGESRERKRPYGFWEVVFSTLAAKAILYPLFLAITAGSVYLAVRASGFDLEDTSHENTAQAPIGLMLLFMLLMILGVFWGIARWQMREMVGQARRRYPDDSKQVLKEYVRLSLTKDSQPKGLAEDELEAWLIATARERPRQHPARSGSTRS